MQPAFVPSVLMLSRSVNFFISRIITFSSYYVGLQKQIDKVAKMKLINIFSTLRAGVYESEMDYTYGFR